MVAALHLLLLPPALLGSTLRQPACEWSGRVERRLRGGAGAQRTFAMLKPDIAADEATVRQIKARIEDAGLAIEREERGVLTREQCEEFYLEHQDRPFYASLVDFMCSGEVVKLELSGDDAVARWRALIGPTNSTVAREREPDSLRALYGTDGQANAAHGSDAPESAQRELALMFAAG